MIVFMDHDEQKHPIKVWLPDNYEIEEQCLDQAVNLANLPFVYKHVALMPDTHSGYGMPIGGVIATEGVVIPNAVGVDIGCGMVFVETNLDAGILKDDPEALNTISKTITYEIPVGFGRHKEMRHCYTVADIERELYNVEDSVFAEEIDNMRYQIGTLGGGNHFIELQEDDNGKLCIMIHSGSRHFGYAVAEYFNKQATYLNEQWHSKVPKEYELAFLPMDYHGVDYIKWMNYALDFAEENRVNMMQTTLDITELVLNKTIYSKLTVQAHHNYARLENHFGKNLWVHRKGAISAKVDELGIVPGAMGSHSYIVSGLGNRDSFCSSSHGAGRLMSRKKAKEKFTSSDVDQFLTERNVMLNCAGGAVDEHSLAYKNIDEVMEAQKELTKVVKKLKPILVVKG